MGNKNSTNNENNCIEELTNINENDLDISNIDKLQIKAIKEIRERILKIEKEKQTKMIYAMPKVDLCNYSLFWFNNIKVY